MKNINVNENWYIERNNHVDSYIQLYNKIMHAFSTLYLKQRILKFILSNIQVRYVYKIHIFLITPLDSKEE